MPTSSVLIVAHRILPARGGLAVATDRIARMALDRGERVEVLTLSKDAPRGGLVTQDRDGLVLHILGPSSSASATLRSFVQHAIRLGREASATLIHGIYASQAGYVATLAARELGVASVVSMRGNDVDEGLFRPQDVPLVESALTHATVLTGVSRPLCETAARLVDRVACLVGNSVDTDRFFNHGKDNTLMHTLGLGQDPVIGFSGELREKKGMGYLLPAFAKLLERRACNLLLIGGIRRECQAAYETFQSLAPEAAKRISVIDYARSPKNLGRWMSLCDLMVFPSLREGMPNAVLEAMACERPILATRVGGHIDLIQHGHTGALMSLDELDELPAAMLEYLDYPQRSQLGKNARAHVCAHHHRQGEREAWAKIYENARSLVKPRGRVEQVYPGFAHASRPGSTGEEAGA